MTQKKNTGLIVGAIVGVLALSCCCVTGVGGALGYASFQRYELDSRLSEARYELTSISTSERASCSGNGFLIPFAGPRTPPATPWTASEYAGDIGFTALGYQPFPSRFFTYWIEVSGAGVAIHATGDADEDGESATHTITCTQADCDCTYEPVSTGDPDEVIGS